MPLTWLQVFVAWDEMGLTLFAPRQILYAYEDETGFDVIASLDFWGRPQSPTTHRQLENGRQ